MADSKSKMDQLAFMNEDQSVLTTHAWRKEAIAESAGSHKSPIDPLEGASVWSEAARWQVPYPKCAGQGHPHYR